MSGHNDLGHTGEELAVEHLRSQGYEILEQNWRFSRAEIDIICKKEAVLIFVEVKAKSYDFYGAPEASVNEKKELMIIDAANRYMEQVDHNWEIRFDIISILMGKKGKYELKHFKDAFH